MVRPEHIGLSPASGKIPGPDGTNEVAATVTRLVSKGALTGIDCVSEAGTSWSALLPTRVARQWAVGDRAVLSFGVEDVHLMKGGDSSGSAPSTSDPQRER